MTDIVEVAVPVPVDGPFHYRVPETLRGVLRTGHRVRVPFGRRRLTGVVVDPAAEAPAQIELKAVESLLDPTPLPEGWLRLVRFASNYYVAPLGEVLKASLPPSLTAAVKPQLRLTDAGRSLARQATEGSHGELHPHLISLSRGPVALNRIPGRWSLWLLERGLCRLDDGLPSNEDGLVDWLTLQGDPKDVWSAIRRAPRKRQLVERLQHGSQPRDQVVREAADGRAMLQLVKAGVLAIHRAPAQAGTDAIRPPEMTLTDEQQDAHGRLIQRLEAPEPGAVLLEGVTGSGKTEVYMRAMAHCLQSGRGALVMVPEIGLTPQVEALFQSRFPGRVVVLHSGLSERERVRRWRALRDGRATVALGPRSAVWAPVQELGIIVVDEEHDSSYKQSSELRYHGRDLALVRGRQERALVVLASATPSLESRHLAGSGRIEHLRLTRRPVGRSLPKVRIIDLLEERRTHKEFDLFSRALQDALVSVFERREQSILFLNRRGLHPFVSCGNCGDLAGCPHCDLTLTLHRDQRLVCHTCGHREGLERVCPKCGIMEPIPYGAGTQRVESTLAEILPEARVLRLDRDVASTPRKLEESLGRFRRREVDILVGTKMVTKGHDFPGVSLVGILMADASLAFPDFRAAESTFQLLTQVAGRAGRGDTPGQVYIQTLQPEHPALLHAVTHDVAGFSAQELEGRRAAGYPPFGRLAMVRCEGKDLEKVQRTSTRLAEAVRGQADVRLLGPTEAPVARIKERHRFRFMLRADLPSALNRALRKVRRQERPAGVDLLIDVDPYDFL